MAVCCIRYDSHIHVRLLTMFFYYPNTWGSIQDKIRKFSKLIFCAQNESKKIQQKFATNRIKIIPLEPEIQPVKGE